MLLCVAKARYWHVSNEYLIKSLAILQTLHIYTFFNHKNEEASFLTWIYGIRFNFFENTLFSNKNKKHIQSLARVKVQ